MILVKTISKTRNCVDFTLSNKNLRIAKIMTFLVVLSITIGFTIPNLSYAQQGSDFIANLSGKGFSPAIDTSATGIAKFHVNPNNTISYNISVKNIDKVIDSYMGMKNNTDLIELINPYSTVLSGPRFTNQFQSAYPTGTVNGELTSGVITSDQFYGPLAGKSISDLANMMKSGQLQVDIRTSTHEHGEIIGQIQPTK